MKALVAYMSKTGNTRKIAEAIYGSLDCGKEIRSLDSVGDIGAFDLVFLGFPIHQFGPDKKTREFLERNCTEGMKVALFVTHASQEDFPELPEWLTKFREAASGAELVGFYNCQGELARGVKLVMKIAPIKKLRYMASLDNSKGQPDSTRVEMARIFAKETLSRVVEKAGG